MVVRFAWFWLLLVGLAVAGPVSRIMVLEDRRQAGPELNRLAQDHDPALRRRAVVALGRIQDPRSMPVLARAAQDADASVRDAAWFALGQMWRPAAEPYLAQGLTVERDPALRPTILEALGKCESTPALGLLTAALHGPGAATAATAIGNAVLWADREHVKLAVPAATVPALLGLLSSRMVPVRQAACYALFRLKVYAPRLDDADALVRALAARSAGAAKAVAAVPALVARLRDPDWKVAVSAAMALGQVQSADSGSALQQAVRDPNPHVARAALQALGPFCGGPTWQLGDLPAGLQPDGVEALARMEKGAARPMLAVVATSPDWRVRRAAATAEADLHDPDGLGMLLADPDARVRVEAVGSLEHADRTWSEPLLLKALRDADDEVAAQAADILAGRHDVAARPGISVWLTRLQGHDRGESLVDFIGDFGKLGGSPETVRWALHDTDPEVRKAAAALLKVPAPAGNPQAWPLALSHPARFDDATVHTNRGDFRMRLFVADAPSTVANFENLAGQGFFNGLTFHRVVPDFVVQGGDPRGDGSGGPGYTLRCEINRHRYDRGAVGMALSGKDTGGSQWFVTHSPQPHLDGRYTCFGQVVSGMAVVDALQEGDRIMSIDLDHVPVREQFR